MVKSAVVEQDKISIEVIKAFYNVSYCKAMVEQMREQLTRDQKDLDGVVRQESLGTKSGADIAELKALVASDEYELLNQENLLKKRGRRKIGGISISRQTIDGGLVSSWTSIRKMASLIVSMIHITKHGKENLAIDCDIFLLHISSEKTNFAEDKDKKHWERTSIISIIQRRITLREFIRLCACVLPHGGRHG